MVDSSSLYSIIYVQLIYHHLRHYLLQSRQANVLSDLCSFLELAMSDKPTIRTLENGVHTRSLQKLEMELLFLKLVDDVKAIQQQLLMYSSSSNQDRTISWLKLQVKLQVRLLLHLFIPLHCQHSSCLFQSLTGGKPIWVISFCPVTSAATSRRRCT